MMQLHQSCLRRPCLATVACCLALAACSGAAAQVHLPPKPPQATTQARARSAPAPRLRVLAAFTGYTAALHEADLSDNPARARRLLRPYLTAARVAGIVRTERSIWAKGERFYGQEVLHVLTVSVAGRRAFVHDCDNTSGMGLESAATGQPVPGTAGIPAENIVTRLDLVRGHWLIQFQLIEDVPCAA